MLKKILNPDPKDKEESSVIMRYSHIGMQFAVSFALPVFGGLYLDKKFDTSPLGIIIGAFLGFGIALYQLIKSAQEMERAMKEEEDQKKKK